MQPDDFLDQIFLDFDVEAVARWGNNEVLPFTEKWQAEAVEQFTDACGGQNCG